MYGAPGRPGLHVLGICEACTVRATPVDATTQSTLVLAPVVRLRSLSWLLAMPTAAVWAAVPVPGSAYAPACAAESTWSCSRWRSIAKELMSTARAAEANRTVESRPTMTAVAPSLVPGAGSPAQQHHSILIRLVFEMLSSSLKAWPVGVSQSVE